MLRLRRQKQDQATLTLFEESGRNVETAAGMLRDLLADYPERVDLVREISACEHAGDRITHDIIHRLDGGGSGPLPFDSRDGHALATALDDIVDFAEEAADAMVLYGVEAPMEQATLLADVLVGAAARVAGALQTLGTAGDMTPDIVEINRLENEGDRLCRDAVASLFATGIDPMFVIRWKDIFDSLEAAIDACEHVAHILEGISLKRHR